MANVQAFAKRSLYYLKQLQWRCLSSTVLSHMSKSPLLFDNVELASNRYDIQRGNFAKATQQDINYFKDILSSQSAVITDAEELIGSNTDWLRVVRGSGPVLLKPENTEQVSKIMQYCNNRNLAVVPQGGKTGLVGGGVPVFDEIILSTSRMNNVIDVDKISGTLVCQPGCILQELEDRLDSDNFILPYDLGARGSCHIGGNLSTNAGGIRLVRYGSLHGSVLGVEAVLADGTVLDCMSTCRKDNTGYDLKQLFIGSEGTLGIITKVAIALAQKPRAQCVALIGCNNFENVKQVFSSARKDLCEYLSACEFMDSKIMSLVENHLKLTNPVQTSSFYVLIEASGSSEQYCKTALLDFLETLIESKVIKEGIVADNSVQIKDVWALRERVLEACQHDGYVFKYDVSLPLRVFYNIVDDLRSRLGSQAKSIGGYGHIGDGNLHINITCEEYNKQLEKAIEPYIFEWIGKYKGSVSAEHGMGFIKRKYMNYSKSEAAYNTMKGIKQLLDPKRRMMDI
ncbi:uncharacterized protein TRIADDRAFT_60696 [Trichoplax adhaerens]|uniref:D-2-hydroxyglutarate dehydrogenase, mitochondrial n=1 Tax=Trichoplax adhaerens TaxID=10228 RepID=B3S947_TRIAD|nr:hypothetical protein TRIADDRAFT_60696 [Trichoplax adhaerens]EDV20735.1 hypothetical protein TRIADDRAFT_60696 [Trichoplax adhaerens]|eukprot:XP_002116676.1 hypothetical protein TRIADDRAFT_60696 [Trichoplax adhaerens]